MTSNEMRKRTRESIPRNQTYFQAADMILDIMEEASKPIYSDAEFRIPLKWKLNSCYMDCVIVCFFSYKTKYTTELLMGDYGGDERLLKELNLIVGSIRKREKMAYCSDMRKIIGMLDTFEHGYDTDALQDSSDFLNSFLGLFERKPTKVIYETVYEVGGLYYNDFYQSDQISISSPDSVRTLYEPRTSELIIEKFIKGEKISEEIIDSPYLVLNIPRRSPGEAMNTNVVIPDRLIHLKCNRILQLVSIVIFIQKRKHYVCYFYEGSFWWYYDDLNDEMELVGSYEQLNKKHERQIRTMATQLYYAPYDATIS